MVKSIVQVFFCDYFCRDFMKNASLAQLVEQIIRND